ncbi:MAG: ATP-binding protein [Bryobacterales bacterium]|nr:ATP-binding protein [Bryobacterales bacterium]
MHSFFSRAKSRILTKVLLGTVMLVAASVVTLSAFFLLRHKAAFEEQYTLRAQALATSLAGQSQFALLMDDRNYLTRMANITVSGGGDVVYVAVEDGGGNLVAMGAKAPLSKASLPRGLADIHLPAVRQVDAGLILGDCVEASIPIVPQADGDLFGIPVHKPELMGRIRVGLSLQSQRDLFLTTLRDVGAIALAILLVACGIGYARIRVLLRPLVELAVAAKEVGAGDYDQPRLARSTDDEVGDLVDSFNRMVEQVGERTRELSEQVQAKEQARAELAETQQRLIALSRQSGMAEVATSVLHNVGNVLNSVNVSATLVAEKVKESRVDKLSALVGMLERPADELGDYLGNDPKGRRVVPYLGNLAGHFRQERQQMIRELEQLTGHIGHIKQIVATQQNYAKVSGLIEEISIRELAEDAIRIVEPSLERHQIEIRRDFEEVPPFISDKHQILQILLNLMRNAKQAVDENERPERLIRVRIRRHSQDRVRVDVKDSGVGLSHENLTRIFAHGFTTKSTGHGFGLHSGALAAKQLGGALWAESEGPGRGAVFTLELPLTPTETRKESEPHETISVR